MQDAGSGADLVSAVTRRHGFQTKINELNRLLEGKQNESDFIFIDNTNILSSEHLWRDRVHLNDSGKACRQLYYCLE